jgi:hypothetical protein
MNDRKNPDWKRLSRVDQDLVDFLRKKYPPIEYDPEISVDEFSRQSIFRSGQREVILALEQIIKLQEKGARP